MWGGRFHPIIPIGDVDLGRQLVKAFRVDLLFPVTEDESVKSFIKDFPYLPNPLFPSQLFIKESSGKIYATLLDAYHPIRRLFEEKQKNNLQAGFQVSLYEWDEDDPLGDVLLATFGGFPPKEETGTDYRGLIEKYLPTEKVSLAGKAPIPADSYKKTTPNWICGLDLQHHYSVVNYQDTPGFYIGSAADFRDLTNYWNLRATDTGLLFYDPDFSGRLDDLRTGYLAVLQARPQGSHGFDARVAIWSQQQEHDLSGFGTSVLRCSLSTATWNGLNVKPPLLQFGEKSVLATVGNSSGRIRVSFALPEKPCFDDVRIRQQHLMASISPGIGLYGNERVTLLTPYLPELNEYYGRNFYFDWNKTRVEPEGLGIIIQAYREDLSLNALEVTFLITKVFDIAGMRLQSSKAGLIASRLIQQVGGLQGSRVFKIAGVRDLIERYKPDQSFTRSAAKQIIGRNDPATGKPNFSEYEELFLEPRPWDTKLRPEEDVDPI